MPFSAVPPGCANSCRLKQADPATRDRSLSQAQMTLLANHPQSAAPRPSARTAAPVRCMVTISIDVEPDDAWTNHQNPSVRNVHELLRLHDLLRPYDARATLLVTQRVIDDEACVRTLRRL